MAAEDFLLNTDLNNQKILLNTQQTLDVGSPGYEGTYSYDHNLGYIPSARVWYEPVSGRWYPITIRQYNDSVSFGFLELLGDYSITTTSITVRVRNLGVGSSCNVWVRLYLDD